MPGPHQGRWFLNIWPSLKEESPGEYLFSTPDGAVHRLHQYSGGWHVATDGSYIGYNPTSKHVAYPSGEFFDFSEYDTNHRIHHVDRNGNRITYVFGSYSGAWRPVQIIDTLGREIDFIYGDSRWSFVTEIRVQNHQGQNLTFGVQYQTITADLSAFERYSGSYRPYYGSSDNAAYPGRVLTQITLPNGTSYGMDYRFDHIYVGGYPPYYDTSTFQLSELTLPTGASLGFEYATPPMPYGYPPGTQDYWKDHEQYAERLSRRIGSITVDPLDGYPFTTTYTYQRDTKGNVTQATETKPDGSKIVTTFNAKDTTYAFLRNVEDTYDTDGTTRLQHTLSYWTDTSYGKRASRTDVQMESTLGFGYLRNEHVYNSMGQQTQEHVYQRWSGERYSSQYWVYASFDWTHYRSLVNRHDQTRWFWDSGWKEAVVARTDYLYDQYSLTNRGTVTQHDPTFNSSYTSRGNVTEVRTLLAAENRFLTTKSYYDTLGNVVQVTDPLNHSTTSSYSSNFAYAYPTQVTDPLGHSASTNYDWETGLVLTKTDANSRTTTFTYDTYNRLVQTDLPDGGQTTQSYDDTYNVGQYRVKTETTRKIDAVNSVTKKEYYDGLGRLLRTEVEQDDGSSVFVDRQYELCTCAGKVARVSTPYKTGEPVYWSERYYDGLGRVTKLVPPDGSSLSNYTEYKYGWIQNYDIGWDVSAQLVGVFDPTGRGRVTVSDVGGGVLEVREDPNPQDLSSSLVTTYRLNRDPNVLNLGETRNGQSILYAKYLDQVITQGVQTRTLTSDNLGRLVSETHPENGTTAYTYNDVGGLHTRTDARGWVTTYSYDNVNRPTGKTYSGDGGVTPSVTYTYDSGTNGIGRMTGWSSTNGVSGGAEYDVLGRTTREWKSLPSNPQHEVNYDYNLAGQKTEFQYPDGHSLFYNYNSVGQLTDLTSSWVDGQHPAGLLTSISYNSAGAVDYALYGNNRELRRGYRPSTGQLQYHEIRNVDRPLTNAGFEEGSGTDASGWDEVLSASRSTERALTGKASMKIAAGWIGNATTSGYIPVQGSSTYTLSGYIYILYRHSGNIYLDLNDGNAQGQNITDVNLQANTSKVGVWQRVAGTFTTAPATTGVKVRIVYDGAQTDMSVVFYADEISITPGTSPPAAAWTYDYRDPASAGSSTMIGIANAGFESGSGTNAYDWNQFGTSRTTTRAHSGSASLKVDHAVGSVLNAATASYIAVEGSTSYWLSAWVYVQSSSGGNLYLDLDDGHGQGEDFNDVTIAANSSLVGSWQHITGMFQTAPGTTGVKVRVVHGSPNAIVAYVDDITLEKEMGDLEAPQNGMIQEIRDQVNPSYSETYSYDTLYRLTHAESSVWTASWSYDRYGNRLSQTTTGVSYSETLSISSTSNRVNGWTYDAAGNVTNDGTHTYQYDAENRLIKIDGGSTAQYAYGPQGERVWKIAAGVTTYFYWGIGEKISGSWTRLYVQGLGGKLVEYSGGTTWFFATNHLGTIAARMNVSGTLMETYRYLPYGERYAGTQTPHQYTGKERDAESGLDYFGARYYASAHGRWMSVDPVQSRMFIPQSLNRYGYVLGNPARYVDFDGRMPTCGTSVWRPMSQEAGLVPSLVGAIFLPTECGELEVPQARPTDQHLPHHTPAIDVAFKDGINLLEGLLSKGKCADALGIQPGGAKALLESGTFHRYRGEQPIYQGHGAWDVLIAYTRDGEINVNVNSGFFTPDWERNVPGTDHRLRLLDEFNKANSAALTSINRQALTKEEFWAVILGHEIGHMKGTMAPNDYRNQDLILQNNRKVIENCIDEGKQE